MKTMPIAFAVLILFCLPVLAQVKPVVKAEDPVMVELAVAKQKYRNVVSEVKKRMISAFDDEDKTVTADKTLKLADKLKLLEQIALDKTAFQVDGTFPKSPGMKEAVDAFQKQLKEAREICETAFDVAAEKRFVTDRKASQLILQEKPEFFKAGGSETELDLKCGADLHHEHPAAGDAAGPRDAQPSAQKRLGEGGLFLRGAPRQTHDAEAHG